jgi:putative ABC transport system permease protein
MLKNYFLIAFRNIRNYGLYSVINILGLSIGLASAILIILYLQHELSADRHLADYDEIFRVGIEVGIGGPPIVAAISSAPLGNDLVTNFPEVVGYSRFYSLDMMHSELLVEYEDRSLYESGVFLADSNFFEFFSHPVVYGDPVGSLRHNNMAVFTRSAAEKIFGPGNPVGKTFRFNRVHNVTVGAVIDDIPANSHLKFRMVMFWGSMDGYLAWQFTNTNYFQNNIFTYVKLVPGFDIRSLEGRIDEFVQERALSEFAQHDMEALFKLHLRPLNELYFQKAEQYEPFNPELIPAKGDRIYIYVFIAIAIFLTGIAAINYMNMAIARSARRSREVGVRKVLGADKGSLIRQFLSESLLITFLGFILALLWVEISLPWFNQLLMKDFSFRIFQNPALAFSVLGLMLVTGLVSGSYPAFYLSRFQPVEVLKQQVKLSDRNLSLRKILVGLQFTISVFMIIATLVVLQQLHFIRNKNLGYQTENILVLTVSDLDRERRLGLKRELGLLPGVESASLSNNVPGPGANLQNWGGMAESRDGFSETMTGVYQVDASFAEVFDLQMKEGRFFNPDLETDFTEAVIVNEAAARLFEWDEPVGKQFRNNSQNEGMRRVVGVVKDFHILSLDLNIGPLVIYPYRNGDRLIVKLTPEAGAGTLEVIRQKWDAMAGNLPLRYQFLAEHHRMGYRTHNNLGVLFAVFAMLCILLSLMGLYGLSGFSAEQKTREIGIRKVHGASLKHILMLLFREYMTILAVAILMASVLAWHFMGNWLAQFAFSVSLTILPFIVAATLAVAVSLLTVGVHAARSSGADPVKALKYE